MPSECRNGLTSVGGGIEDEPRPLRGSSSVRHPAPQQTRPGWRFGLNLNQGFRVMRIAAILSLVLAFSLPLVGAQGGQGGTSGSAAPPIPNASAIVKKGNAQRGQYLVTHVAMCIECHSERDDEGTLIQGRQFMGGPIPTRPSWARDWAERAPRNAGLPGYTDEQALRLLTEGAIARDGRQLRPPMPRFRMTPEDAADVIAFMRSLS